MPGARPLRALIVEDSIDDYELLIRSLSRGDYDVTGRRVASAAGLREALHDAIWDLVISDWVLPGFSMMEALAIVREHGIDVPFIIVSGVIGEEVAVEALRAGAHDFMTKDRMARLVPAVERELREAKVRVERNRMREQLAISERMASVGMLAAGVAHEVNNPLAAIVANLDLAKRELAELPRPTSGSLAEELSDAYDAALRIRDIVADLAMFSRSARDTVGPVDVHRVLDSTLRVAANEIRHRARLVRHFAPVPRIDANESRLGQVFLNLVVNAAQAIPEGHVEAHEICVSTGVAGDGRVVVEFRDTGVGIPADVRSRMFAPFYTTKPFGLGTGLGLSICHRLVTELGGEISVESQVGHGSKFRVYLPVSRQHGERAVHHTFVAQPTRRGRVLVVDDELLIANAIARALQPEHDTTTVQRGQAALDLLREGERYDVILCDVMMPEMSGIEMFELVRASWPELAENVIFMSGGTFTNEVRAFLERLANAQIGKPFDLDALRALINGRVR